MLQTYEQRIYKDYNTLITFFLFECMILCMPFAAGSLWSSGDGVDPRRRLHIWWDCGIPAIALPHQGHHPRRPAVPTGHSR